jgi:hypothetical protein
MDGFAPARAAMAKVMTAPIPQNSSTYLVMDSGILLDYSSPHPQGSK